MILGLTSCTIIMMVTRIAKADNQEYVQEEKVSEVQNNYSQISENFKIVNFENLFIVMENGENAANQYFKFIQIRGTNPQQLDIKLLTLHEVVLLEESFDKYSVFNLIRKYKNNPQAVISLTPLRKIQLPKVELKLEQSESLQLFGFQDYANQGQVIWLNTRPNCTLFDFVKVSSFLSFDFINVDLNQRIITLNIEYNPQNQIKFGELIYENCQSFLQSIDYELINYLGFIQVKIYLTINQISTSINCTMTYPQISVSINVLELNQDSQTLIDYYFSYFDEITKKNAIFENRSIFLQSNTLSLQNIVIRSNPSIIFKNCNTVILQNIRIKENSPFQINSQDTMIQLSDIEFSDLQIENQYYIQIYGHVLNIEIKGLIIKDSHLDNFILIQCKQILVQIMQVQNLTILNSTLRNSSLFPYSNKIVIFDIKIEFTSILIATLIRSNVLFIKDQFIINSSIQNTTLYLGTSIQLYKIEFRYCAFSNSTLIKDIFPSYHQTAFLKSCVIHDFKLVELQFSENINHIEYLIDIQASEQSSFKNILIDGEFKMSLLNVDSEFVQMESIILTNITYGFMMALANPFVNIGCEQLIVNQLIINQFNILSGQVIFIRTKNMILRDSYFLDLNFYYNQGVLLQIYANDLILDQISIKDSKVLNIQPCPFARLTVNSLEIKLLDIKFIYNSAFSYMSIQCNIVSIKEASVQVIGQGKAQIQLFFVIASEIEITQSTFRGVYSIISSTYNQIQSNSIIKFTNNKFYLEHSSINVDLNIIECFGYQSALIQNNYFLINDQPQYTVIHLRSSSNCEITDNIIIKSARIINIILLNKNSTTIIRNLTIADHGPSINPYGNEGVKITNGYDYQYIKSNNNREYHVASSTGDLQKVSILNMDIQQIDQTLIEIIFEDDNIIEFTNITIRKVQCNNFSLGWNHFIRIFGHGNTQIVINNLKFTNFSCSVIYLKNIFDIESKFTQINLENMLFINIQATLQIFKLQDRLTHTKAQVNISRLIVYNQQCGSLIETNVPNIKISESILYLKNESKIIKPEMGIIELSELIYEVEPVNHSEALIFDHTIQTYTRKDHSQSLRVSFDGGLKFALNKELTEYAYQALFHKNKNYFLIPTGQYFNNFQTLNIKNKVYLQHNITFQFSANMSELSECVMSLMVGHHVLNNYKFNIQNQSWQNLMIVKTPGTLIKFIASCNAIYSPISLQFSAKIMNCQIGEILLQEKCQPCSSRAQQFSVIRNSTLCQSIDQSSMEKVDRGLIYLKQGFWRPFFSNIEIETCQSTFICLGGYDYGNKLCGLGTIGAICSECDLFMEINTQRYHKNQQGNCNQCNIGVFNILGQIINFMISGAILLSNVLKYRQIIKQTSLIIAVQQLHQIIIKYSFDLLSIYTVILFDYIQNVFLISRTEVLFLMPFDINIDFITNTSFTFINFIDCLLNNYFDQNYWIYIRLGFILISYIWIFQVYILIQSLYLNLKRQRYQYLLISTAIIIIYQGNYLGFFNQLILLISPIKISGLTWIQSYKTFLYNNIRHFTFLKYLLFPAIFTMVVYIPIYIYYNARASNGHKYQFYYLQYNFQQPVIIIIQMIFKFMLITVMNLLQRQQAIRIISLGIILSLNYQYLQYFQIYKLKKINDVYTKLQFWFALQLMIHGIIAYTDQITVKYLLILIFYVILAGLIVYGLKAITEQLLEEYFYFFDKLRVFLGRVLGTSFPLRQYRITQINQYYKVIRNKMLRRGSNINV